MVLYSDTKPLKFINTRVGIDPQEELTPCSGSKNYRKASYIIGSRPLPRAIFSVMHSHGTLTSICDPLWEKVPFRANIDF